MYTLVLSLIISYAITAVVVFFDSHRQLVKESVYEETLSPPMITTAAKVIASVIGAVVWPLLLWRSR